MMKILTCYIPPSEGSAHVCDFDVREQSMEVRQRVGYLPEHNPLYQDMYVREYLSFVGGIHKLKNVAKAVEEVIEMVGLGTESHKLISALSKGYRQRVGLASALIHQPDVLILDEPTSGLDPNQLVEIRELIRQTGKEKTVLLSTHIMQEVEAICDRVIIINKGEVVADRPVHEMSKLAMGGRTVVEVEFSGQVTQAALQNIAGVLAVRLLPNGHWELESEVTVDIRPAVAEFASKTGLYMLTVHKKEASLEEVFKELTGNGVGF
jgi:ABC-2 type transport system ATP-binding protein